MFLEFLLKFVNSFLYFLETALDYKHFKINCVEIIYFQSRITL